MWKTDVCLGALKMGMFESCHKICDSALEVFSIVIQWSKSLVFWNWVAYKTSNKWVKQDPTHPKLNQALIRSGHRTISPKSRWIFDQQILSLDVHSWLWPSHLLEIVWFITFLEHSLHRKSPKKASAIWVCLKGSLKFIVEMTTI